MVSKQDYTNDLGGKRSLDVGAEHYPWSPLSSETGWNLPHNPLVKKPGIQHGDQLFLAMPPEYGHVLPNTTTSVVV